ncbi:Eukaryotic protein of unknown function (DUF829) [seawater metagenome]|uniref:Alpha/beta hydrolase family n=1 Tax=seawater metagenome TaxID=1561972 RepID=A0A5E8CKF8_9ZZZZ
MAYIPRILTTNMNKSRQLMKKQIKNISGLNENTQVCLIGFQGSTEKQLKRHIQIYKDKNLDTLVFTPGYLQNYIPKYVNSVALEISEQLENNNKKIIFHAISGGCYPLSLTLNNIIKNGNKDLIDKIIYDSSPVKCTICSAITAFQEKMPLPKFLIKNILELHYYKSQLPINEWCHDFYTFMGSRLLDDVPKLFLTSDSDTIVPMKDVDAFLTGQRNYEKIIFPDAIHAKNILKDNELYMKSINDFLNKK